MRHGSYFVFLILFFASSVSADIVESFYVFGSPFETGAPGLLPGTQESLDNEFDTNPLTGAVKAFDPREILAGGGDVAFTALADGSTEIHFDMGAGIAVTSIPGGFLTDSEIVISGIEADADATNFLFQFTAQFVDGSPVNQITDFDITATLGSLDITSLDLGLFEGELSSNPGTSAISISTSSGGLLRAVQFRSIVPDFETDELTVSGNRTLFTPVPEPGSLIFLGLIGILIASGRRKTA